MIKFLYEHTDERWRKDAGRPDKVITVELATDPSIHDQDNGCPGLLSHFRDFLLAIGYPVEGDLIIVDEAFETVINSEELNDLYHRVSELEDEEDGA